MGMFIEGGVVRWAKSALNLRSELHTRTALAIPLPLYAQCMCRRSPSRPKGSLLLPSPCQQGSLSRPPGFACTVLRFRLLCAPLNPRARADAARASTQRLLLTNSHHNSPDTPQPSPVSPSTPQYSPVLPSTPQYSPVLPSTPQYPPVLPSTPQYSPVLPSTPQYTPALARTN